MIPIRDTVIGRNPPVATWIIIGLNVVVFYWELGLSTASLQSAVHRLGVVPALVTQHNTSAGQGTDLVPYWSLFTSLFLHGGWVHLIGNMWTLWIFGDNVEGRMGPGRFTLFYLACGLAAGLCHVLFNKITVVVPHYAMSGGTLIALAANQIVMSPNAVLGPVDPQLGEYPAASLRKVVKEKPIARIDDQTLILADQAEMAITQVRKCIRGLLADNLSPERADELASKLSEGGWTHDHPIGFAEAHDLGLPVSDQIPGEFMQLLGLYPQPMRTDRSVEYLPGAYRSTPKGTTRRL